MQKVGEPLGESSEGEMGGGQAPRRNLRTKDCMGLIIARLAMIAPCPPESAVIIVF